MSFESFALRADITIVDGRQSETALSVARGTGRLLKALGFTCISEMSLTSGRRADLVALGADGEIVIVEIKSSIADFRADTKWPEYRWHCDRLFFATAPHVPAEIFPEEAGLIIADGYGAEVLREAPVHKLAGATRRSMTLRLARLGASRLQSLIDPAGGYEADL
jgi:hypothetical protein